MYKSKHTEYITRGAGDKRDGRGSTKQWGTKTLGDLWKEEGWGRVHRVNKMDTTGTLRSLQYRDFEGGGFGVD